MSSPLTALERANLFNQTGGQRANSTGVTRITRQDPCVEVLMQMHGDDRCTSLSIAFDNSFTIAVGEAWPLTPRLQPLCFSALQLQAPTSCVLDATGVSLRANAVLCVCVLSK